jgi:tetratricopeptide (TPR) repeat protein
MNLGILPPWEIRFMKIRTTILGVLFLSFATRLFAQSDQIVAHSGDITRGAIKSITPNEVEIEERGTPRKIPRSQIRTINFANEPRELRAGRDAALGDKYEEALENLAKVKADDLNREELKQELAYYTAYSKGKLALSGEDRVAADKELFDFVKANGQSFHFYEAAELLGDLAFSSGNFEDAARRYGALARSDSPDLKMRSAQLEGKSLQAKGDSAGALAKFEQVLSSPLNDSGAAKIKAHCEVGKARSLIDAGKAVEGITLAQSVIDRNDPKEQDLFAAAYNALGAGYLKSDQKKNAIIAFLYVDLLFPSDQQAHAEALYHLEKLWTDQGKTDRAQACRNMLREQYGGTVWATKG